VGGLADSSSDGWAVAVRPGNVAAARRWLWLGFAALAGAGLFAVVLLLARIPGADAWLAGSDLFRIALVLHTDLPVPIWFLAFCGVLWTLRDGPHAPWGDLAFYLAAAGTGLVMLSPFVGSGEPVLGNFIPVLTSRLFVGGLTLFAVGVALRGFMCLQGGLDAAHRNPVSAGLVLVAAATVLAAFTVTRTLMKIPAVNAPQLYYELLFWPVGHVLQFAYTALALTACLWLATGTGLRPFGGPRLATMLLLSGILPLFGVPLIEMMTVAGSGEHLGLYTTLLRWGGLWPAVPMGLLLLGACLLGPRAAAIDRPVRSALYASLLLFALGGGIGWLISAPDAEAPLHYRSLIVGVTLALMGLTYLLLPRLGYRAPEGWLARLQPWLYAGGQLFFAAGLTWSGLLEPSLDGDAGRTLLVSLSEFGRLLAVTGELLFLVVCYRAMRRRHPAESS